MKEIQLSSSPFLILNMSSDNEALIPNTDVSRVILADAQLPIFPHVYTVSLFGIIPRTVDFDEKVNHCFFSAHSFLLAWGDADVKHNDLIQKMLWNLCADQLPKQQYF